MRARIIAVGDPPVFRQQVAQASEVPAESIEWTAKLSDPEEFFGPSNPEADVLVISPAIGEDDVLAIAQLAGRYSPTTAVLLVRDSANMNGRLPSYMRAGIRDIVDLSREDLGEALQRALQWSANLKSSRPEDSVDEAALARVLTVFSSKGGTGKTFLATNLAAAIAEKTRRNTAIVDLDLSMGDVFSYFGSEPTRPLVDLAQSGMKISDEALMTAATRISDHLYAFGSPPDPGAPEVAADDIATMIRAMRKTFGHVVVDSPAGYTDQVLPALDYSDMVLLVASLDVVGIKHLAKSIETLTNIGLPKDHLFVVLNRADSQVGLEIADVEKVTKIKIDALIPSSRLVPMSLNHGRPVILEDPKSPVAQAVMELADKLIKHLPDEPIEDASTDDTTKRPRFRLRRG